VAWFDRLLRQAGRPDLVLATPDVPAAVVGILSAVTVGAVLASRRPAHPVGWLLTPTGTLPQGRTWPWWATLAAAWSLVVRFRRARGTERQQLRWIALAAVLTVTALLGLGSLLAAGITDPVLLGWATAVCITLLPLATGAAILRYRLYDLDRVISRSLAYGLLTVLLGLGDAGVVLGLGRLLPQGSSLAVAGATLAVAAAFQPLRRRVQAAVDRRFNRRHDAARIIEGFGFGCPVDPGGSRQIVWMIKQSANSIEPVGSSVPAETEDIGGQPDIRPPRGTLAGRSRTRRLIP
jgi:hypothetical protein